MNMIVGWCGLAVDVAIVGFCSTILVVGTVFAVKSFVENQASGSK